MNKYQAAIGWVAYPERDKVVNAASKRRAGTKRASFAVSVAGANAAIARRIDDSRRPTPPPIQLVGRCGPPQIIRSWRRT